MSADPDCRWWRLLVLGRASLDRKKLKCWRARAC